MNRLQYFVAIAEIGLLQMVAGCDGSKGVAPAYTGKISPVVEITALANSETSVAVNNKVLVVFNVAMDAGTLNSQNFTAAAAGKTPVIGAISVNAIGNMASFTQAHTWLELCTPQPYQMRLEIWRCDHDEQLCMDVYYRHACQYNRAKY